MPNEPSFSPESLTKLLDSARAELLALETAALVRPKVDRARAMELTERMVSNFSRTEPSLDAELSSDRAKQRRAQAQGLEARAWVFFAADLRAEETYADTVKTRRDHLAARVAEHDKTLFKWASPLLGGDPKLDAVLRDISLGTGRSDDAEDTLRLVELFRENWGAAAGQTAITKEYLAVAEAEATELLALLLSGATNPARDLARRAYAVWRIDYNDLMETGRYVMRADPASKTLFPGIFAVPGRTSGPASSAAEPDLAADGSEPGADAVAPGDEGTT